MKNFYCIKCDIHIESKSILTLNKCPGGGSHKWNNLGKVGGKTYKCQKCKLTVLSHSTPVASTCIIGGSHDWAEIN